MIIIYSLLFLSSSASNAFVFMPLLGRNPLLPLNLLVRDVRAVLFHGIKSRHESVTCVLSPQTLISFPLSSCLSAFLSYSSCSRSRSSARLVNITEKRRNFSDRKKRITQPVCWRLLWSHHHVRSRDHLFAFLEGSLLPASVLPIFDSSLAVSHKPPAVFS